MTDDAPNSRDDRVLPVTRGLSLAIIPFLLVAFVLLYLFPGDTKRLFAWTINPTMTPMMLASAYLGGAYFFVRVLKVKRWNVVRTGFLSVCLFASLLGIATIVHWDRFNHHHVTFWLWSGLYFTTPFLVFGCWFVNRRYAAAPRDDERRLGSVAQWVIGVVGLLALAQGIVMFLRPSVIIPNWPWLLTPLTCQVLGAIFCLGSAGIAVLRDARWSSVKLMLEVEILMVALILIAAVRARAEFYPGRPLTWLLLGGFVFVLASSVVLLIRENRAKAATP